MIVIKRFISIFILAVLFNFYTYAQSHTAFPVDISAGPAPQVFMAGGGVRLLYELRLTNFSSKQIKFIALDVFGTDTSKALATYSNKELEKLLVMIGPTDTTAKLNAIGGGRTVMIFLDLSLSPNTPIPAMLQHRFSLSIAAKDGHIVEKTLINTLPVIQAPAIIIKPPLRGPGWVAFNGLSNPDHRRTMLTIDGKMRISQRFAIDWAQLGPDGHLFHGDAKSNANFYSYGAQVMAVADGRVTALMDNLPENIGSNTQESRSITLTNVTGNHLVLDLGNGHYALYAHLQPGSLRVKLNDKVKAGQVIALLGNTGNSDAPHLHFQLMDTNSPLAAEGIPYELTNFTQTGIVDDPDGLDTGKRWQPETAPVLHKQEFPVDNAVVNFP